MKGTKFDYVIVGAGAAGCIVASRLSEDPRINVLLVEAGGSDRSLISAMPAALPFAYQSKRFNWGYLSGPEPFLNNRTIDEKRGKAIGGSTTINAMIFNRGNPMDLEGWAAAGLADWSYANCLPYYKKMETFEGGADQWRGGEGPMRISRCKAAHKLHDVFLRGGEQAGYAVAPDHNGENQEGLHVAQAYIHNGQRFTPARGYLDGAAKRENLRVLKNAAVTRMLIENGAAVGITVEGPDGSETVECEREVILCAGAFGSPQLLMLSGIGDGAALRRLGIELKADVPAVGQNLENHPGINIQYAARFEDSLASDLTLPGQAKLGAQWLLTRKGLGASNFFETGAFLKSREDVAFPDMQFEFLPLTRQMKNGRLIAIPGFQFWMDLCRPQSRGTLTLRSANPKDHPSIVFNHMSARQDVTDMIAAVRLARKLIAQAAWDKFRGGELTPGPDVNSEAELENFIRAQIGTSFHPSGSCRMGVDDEAVVDSDGRVKAVRRLRVIDASIMPTTVSGNLSATVMMMAEKLSDRIKGAAL